MIKSNELRIGNWVQDEHGDIMFVYRIWQDGVELSADATGSDDIDYEDKELFGIPLNIVVLEKCGFVNKNHKIEDALLLKKDNRFCFYSSVGAIVLEFNNAITGRYDLPTEAKFLHQLQNLYFAINNEDLSVHW